MSAVEVTPWCSCRSTSFGSGTALAQQPPAFQERFVYPFRGSGIALIAMKPVGSRDSR